RLATTGPGWSCATAVRKRSCTTISVATATQKVTIDPVWSKNGGVAHAGSVPVTCDTPQKRRKNKRVFAPITRYTDTTKRRAQCPGEIHHLCGFRDHDRLAFEAPEPMTLPAMMALDVMRRRFTLDPFVLWDDRRIGRPFVCVVHVQVVRQFESFGPQ